MKWLVGCEFTGTVRRALRARGIDAWSCDLLPAEDSSPHHIQGDLRDVLRQGWDAAILHPPCTRLTYSGAHWLFSPPPGKTRAEMKAELEHACRLFAACLHAPIRHIAIENPVMHRWAKARIPGFREHDQQVQPYWFGHPAIKKTRLWLKNLPPLRPTDMLEPPLPGSEEHKAWQFTLNVNQDANRGHNRSRTFPGLAEAMAVQWGLRLARHYERARA